MTTVVLNRRNLLAAGGAVLATGVSGLLFPPARKACTDRFDVGRGEQLPQGRADRDRIGKGGFWMSGSCSPRPTSKRSVQGLPHGDGNPGCRHGAAGGAGGCGGWRESGGNLNSSLALSQPRVQQQARDARLRGAGEERDRSQ